MHQDRGTPPTGQGVPWQPQARSSAFPPAPPSGPPLGQPTHSPDQSWWWSGTQWLPAVSPDGQWWFNGLVWVRTPARRRSMRPSRIEWAIAAVWLLLWALAITWGLDAGYNNPHGDLSARQRDEGYALAVATLALLPLCAFVLGWARRWLTTVVLTIGVWVLVCSAYAITALAAASADQDPASDNGIAAGLVIYGIPLLLIIGVLVAASAGIGAGARRLIRRDRGHRPRPQ